MTVSSNAPPASTLPSLRSLLLAPVLITLGVTLLRVSLEFAGAPAWLANSEAGGPGALVGIAWLPLLFGPWFALRLRPHVASGKALFKPLAKTLVLYGLGARIPVVAVTIAALLLGWDVHYAKFPPDFQPGLPGALAVTTFFQLVAWGCIWTPVVGMVAGGAALFLRGSREPAAA